LGIAAMSASAQVNYKMQVACSPQDVKTYDTNRLRSSFLMEKVMVPNEINVTYSMYDRLIFGGAVPATKELVLETIDPLKSKFFLERRELGVINIGGEGIVTVDGKEYTLKFKDALYVGRGKQKVTFKSKDSSNPAKFYINSATAHKEYKTQLITIDGRKGSLKANSFAAGKMEESNDRVINQLIVNNVLEEGPCQLQMGLTELKPGSVWNTMPAHTHSRRVEHTSISMYRQEMRSVTSWANLKKSVLYGCRMNKLSCHRNGLFTLLPEQATTCLSGVWQVKTSTTEIWTKSNIQKCANRCVFLFIHIINDPKNFILFSCERKE